MMKCCVFFIHSQFQIICSILIVHARKEIKDPAPVRSPPTSHSTPLLISYSSPQLHTAYISTIRSPLFSCLLFTKVWLSISSGLGQQALMKRPLRQGDPNQISIRMLNIHMRETSKGKCFLISVHKYHLCAFPGPGALVLQCFLPQPGPAPASALSHSLGAAME